MHPQIESHVFKKPQVKIVTNFHEVTNCRKNNCFKISSRIKTCRLQSWSCFLARIIIRKSKRGSLPLHINWAKHNEKACHRTVTKAAKMINKTMLKWIGNRPREKERRYIILSATWCFSREKNILFKWLSMWWRPVYNMTNVVSLNTDIRRFKDNTSLHRTHYFRLCLIVY